MWQHLLTAVIVLQVEAVSTQTSAVTQSTNAEYLGGPMETTMMNPPPSLRTVIAFSPQKFVSITPDTSSSGHYAGYIAKVGDMINITCDISKHPTSNFTLARASSSLTPRIISPEPGRVIRLVEDKMIKIMILNASQEDSGRYACANDGKLLTIIDPANPPKVLSYQCISHRYRNLVCDFLTNSNSSDLVGWKVTYNTSPPRTCFHSVCKNVPCSSISVVKSADHNQKDVVRCEIKDWFFTGVTYNITVTGSNSYVSSSANFSVDLGTQLARLGPPTILTQTPGYMSVAVNVQLYEKDMHAKTLDIPAPGFLEIAIANGGVRYQVTLDSEELKSTTKNWTVPKVYLFEDSKTDTWLQIHNLLPFTTYTLDIITQLNRTVNPTVWSNVTRVTMTTLESKPEVAPENNRFGFSVSSYSTRCSSGRMVTLYWKKVPEVSGKGNGIIKFYAVYNLVELDYKTPEELMETVAQTNFDKDNEFAQMTVNGSNARAEVCITSVASELVVVAVNSAGWGKKGASFHIPATQDVIDVRACDIAVVYYDTIDTLLVSWSNIPQGQEYNIIIFWCEVDIEENCLNKDIEWKEIINGTELRLEQWRERMTDGRRYKFGLSVHADNYNSSGIIWARCTNYIDKDIIAASASVTIQGLTAQIKIIDECHLDSRLAERYVIGSCRYDPVMQQCLENTDEEKEDLTDTEVDPCQMDAQFFLSKHSTAYAFWVVSHAGAFYTQSEVVVKTTDRKALTWEIAVPVTLSLLSVVGITLCLVYCNGQRKRVQKFKNPQLVLPTPSLIAEDDSSCDSDESVVLDHTSFVQYATPSHPLMPLITPDSADMEMQPLKDYENGLDSCASEGCDSSSTYGKHLPPTFSYQPKIIDSTNSTGYRNASNAESCAQLPDDYLQCTTAEPELSLSAQWFLADDSNSAFIDLNKFLVDSDNQPNSKVEPVTQRVSTPSVAELSLEMEADTELSIADDTSEQVPNCDYNKTEASRWIPESTLDNNNYCKLTECYPQSALEPIRPDNDGRDSLMDTTENSSGDSGYVGRNTRPATMPRTNSISSNDS